MISKTRIKFHQFPGDLPKADKINLLEGNSKQGKSFKKIVQSREKAVRKQEDKKIIKESID